ncbi:ankyrin repeat-containing domain protein [Aspergillus cavernicola]|uniref:Ankyrin repeat-containing domain protein n=1 Tax=Aspergillus cavernicola TaxID=176166 RepID=A0ABR4HIA7_9EURO
MAEAIGLAVNIAAILQLATEVAQLSYNYARDVKNAPKTQKHYLQQVSSLIEVLFRVDHAIQDAETTGLLPERPSSLSDNALMDCYKALSGLQFDLQKRRSRILQPFHEREWKAHVEMIHKYRELFADFLASCILVTGNATYRKVSSLSQEQDRNLLLAALSASNVSVRQRPSSCPGTGKWFLEQQPVQDWVGRSLDFLWCYGPPGVGKSCLASILIDHLLDNRIPADCSVVYFFCDFSSQDQQKTLDILHHLLYQIIQQGNGDMLAALKEACKDPSNLHNANEVTQVIVTAGSVQPIYLVLDALDELRDPTGILSHILTLVASGINVLLTSRDLPHIRKKVQRATHFQVDSNPGDLKLYINSRFRASDFSDEIDEESSVISDVVSKSGNLFLLARLMLDDMLDLATVNQIRKALGKPQASLEQAFEATMERIDFQSKARSSLARRLLGWITYAKRRLRLDEVLCAFAVEDDVELDPENMPNPDILLRACLGLVAVDQVDKTVGLVHTTAYEFFKAGKISETDTNLDMARTSLQYLTMKPLSSACDTTSELQERFETLDFLEYSAKHWGQHIRGTDDQRQLNGLIVKLLGNPGLRDSSFQALQFRQEFADEALAEELLKSMPKEQGSLHVAAYWSLTHTAEAFIADGENVSGVDSHKWSPLHWACSRGNVTVSELLLEHGADVNAQDIQGWTPLFWAAFNGNSELVNRLLSHGAYYLTRSTFGWTALHWAVSGGHSNVVQQLLEHHSRSQLHEPRFSEMSIQDIVWYHDTDLPVEMAADGKDTQTFDLLVQHLQTPSGSIRDAKFNMIWSRAGFDSPASRNPWRTMTKSEMVLGRESIIPRLTGPYADDSNKYRADPRNWKSVLLASAIRDEQLSSVQLLVKAGADVNFENALHVAACRQDPRFAKCLLDNGAEPNNYNLYGRTALHEAVLNGFRDTIIVLINGGADVNQPIRQASKFKQTWERSVFNNIIGSTPLIQACGFTFSRKPQLALDIAHLLLSRGANVHLADASGLTVLHYAVMRPHVPLVQLLIKAGCHVDAVDGEGRMAIHLLANIISPQHQTLNEIMRAILGAGSRDTSTDMLNQPTRRSPSQSRNYRENMDPLLDDGASGGSTPVAIALKGKRWQTALTFHHLGARIPDSLVLEPILDSAIRELAVDVVDLLLHHGGRPPSDGVLGLVRALTKQSSSDKILDSDPYLPFKHILLKIVAVGAEIDFQSQDGETALTEAARKPGRVHVLQDLVGLGASVFATSDLAFDTILAAALYSDSDSLTYFLEHAAGQSNDGHWSRYLNELQENTGDCFRRLSLCLQQAGTLNKTNLEGCTLLHLAADCGNSQLVAALLVCGARADIADNKGWLAVHHAGFSQHTPALRTLLPLAADAPCNQSLRPAEQGKQFWIDSLEKTNDHNLDILQHAVRENNIEMVHHLLDYGMNLNTRLSKEWLEKPILSDATKNGHSELVSILLDHGANIEATDKHGWRPLHEACYYGNRDIVTKLIAAGCDIDAPTVEWNNSFYKPSGIYAGNKWNGQPFHLAVMAENTDIVKLLLDKGVDIHASTGGELSYTPAHGPTALHLALDNGSFHGRAGFNSSKNRLQIAEWLVNRGARIDGIIQGYSLEEILKFKDFPDLWDALRDMERDARSI